MTDTLTKATLLGERLPVELMNTVSAERGRVTDALSSDAEVAAWVRAVAGRISAEAGTSPELPDEDALRSIGGELRQLRDALRRLAAETTQDPRPAVTAPNLGRQDAIDTINALAQTWPELCWPTGGNPRRVHRSHGSTALLAVELIAHQGVELFTGPDRARLRPCLAPNCLLYFVKDHGRREWCSTLCGNRIRAARHYQRHRTTQPHA
ncbi:CGNR zinc finger domain-containing protein [Streptomyces sp. Tue6028]|uniref:CGNR zinc finger domain-containing protein n=1 Tax=Streptomyces sp. Tue6028 TaxID=2036037 RepID=UPI003EC0CD5D